MLFPGVIRYIAIHREKKEALDRMIVYCINHGIFGNFCKKTNRNFESVKAGVGTI